jgi:hypothetical protein
MNWRKSSRSVNTGACVEAANWRKSSHSINNGACVEAGSWRKSSHSNPYQCVEAAHGPGVIGIRDSPLGDASPVIEVSPVAWREFISRVRRSTAQ